MQLPALQEALRRPDDGFCGLSPVRLRLGRSGRRAHLVRDLAGRGFCGDCGSRVCALDDGSDAVFVTIMSLDDDRVFVPRNQHFRDDAVSWLPQVPAPTAAV